MSDDNGQNDQNREPSANPNGNGQTPSQPQPPQPAKDSKDVPEWVDKREHKNIDENHWGPNGEYQRPQRGRAPTWCNFKRGISGNPNGLNREGRAPKSNIGEEVNRWISTLNGRPLKELQEMILLPDELPVAKVIALRHMLRAASSDKTALGVPIATAETAMMYDRSLGKPRQDLNIEQHSTVEVGPRPEAVQLLRQIAAGVGKDIPEAELIEQDESDSEQQEMSDQPRLEDQT